MFKDKTISIQLETLPETPGVYQFFNEKNEILYKQVSYWALTHRRKQSQSYWCEHHREDKYIVPTATCRMNELDNA